MKISFLYLHSIVILFSLHLAQDKHPEADTQLK